MIETCHPLVEAAAAGELPAWSVTRRKRREHIERVAQLMTLWAHAIAPGEVLRWRAAAWLHDCLRDADQADLKQHVPEAQRDWPPPLLHGPAAVTRLREEGVDDDALLDAICYHTVGAPNLAPIGHALFAADYLDPGRDFALERRDALRDRMPHELTGVVRDVLHDRIAHLLDCGVPLRRETVDFWNELAESASSD